MHSESGSYRSAAMRVDGGIDNNESIAIAWIMNILTSLMDMIEMTSIYKWHKDQCGHIVD